MFILYRATQADGNGNISPMALSFYERRKQRHFGRHVARPDRVRKYETLEADSFYVINEAQIFAVSSQCYNLFSHLTSLEQLARRVVHLNNFALSLP